MFVRKLVEKSTKKNGGNTINGLRAEEVNPCLVFHYGILAGSSSMAYNFIQHILAITTNDGHIKLFRRDNTQALLHAVSLATYVSGSPARIDGSEESINLISCVLFSKEQNTLLVEFSYLLQLSLVIFYTRILLVILFRMQLISKGLPSCCHEWCALLCRSYSLNTTVLACKVFDHWFDALCISTIKMKFSSEPNARCLGISR